MVLRSDVCAVVLLVGSVFALPATGNAGPAYGAVSVTVPFVNAAQLGDPTQYVSPQLKVGFNSPNATGANPAFNVTMDTGSVGFIVGSSYFAPPANGRLDSSFIGPGSETLTSSGIIFTGDWYKTTVNLYSGNTVVATSTIPVLAVTQVSCEPNARVCNPNTIAGTAPSTHYFGIGFSGGNGLPQGTPDKNAFLNVTSISGSSLLPSPGYILSTQGVQIGLTSSNTQGFALIKLEPLLAPNFSQWQTAPASANLLTDWQHARATITVNGTSGTGSILFDTGVTTGFLTPPTGVTPTTGAGPSGAECNGSKPATCAVSGTKIQVSFSVASFSYTVGANNGPQSGNPVSPVAVSVEQHSAPFLNTTVRFLQAFNYSYDAANGFIGLKATGVTPAQYAVYTPSGLTLSGAFQCFFNWAQGNFGLSSNGSQMTTNYSWPYTYSYSSSMHGLRYGPNGQTSIAVSSGSPGTTPATTANDVYILGANGQTTNEGALSGWLSAAGCQ
jgi:hypothetical protein